ncbi:MAG TPA: DUF763 domain-containing protein, partial [Gammaproteobacteria bacterium]|nr:DUF763 domain-containing protein [Gammaproteobacteria bacterium]
LGRAEELAAIERLDSEARKLEHHADGPAVEAVMASETDLSPYYGGRSVFGWAKEPATPIDRRARRRRT